jgi:hypothetical protein
VHFHLLLDFLVGRPGMTEAAVILTNAVDVHADTLQLLTCIIHGPFTIAGWQQHTEVQ